VEEIVIMIKINISSGVLSIIKDNGLKYLALSDGIKVSGEDYYFTIYIMDCSLSWNMPNTRGNICTKAISTNNFVKVGEWAGEGQFIEMNIYQFGLYATSKFDPSMVVPLRKEELEFLPYQDFAQEEIQLNTELHEYIKALEKL
jgi:hypothetical protein